MRVSDMRTKDYPPNAKGFRTLAEFSLDVSDDLRIFDMKLVRAPDGRHLAYVPRHNDGPVAALSPALRDTIAHLASETLEALNSAGNPSHGRRAA